MTKLAGLSLLYFCVGSLCTIIFEFFGPINYNEVTFIGWVIALSWAVIFISQKTVIVDFDIARQLLLRRVLYVLLFAVLAMSALALLRFGPSPFVGAMIGVDVNSLLLHGQYREQLPLRALAPPAAVVTGVFTYICYRKNILKVTTVSIISMLLFFFVSVYETRHVLIWVIIYVIGIEVSRNGLTKLISMNFKNWKLALLILLFFFTFKIFGEIRSGLGEYLDDAGPAFAQGMGLEEKYWEIGLSFLWIVIYMFSSFARGMENDALYPLFDFAIPAKLFPGPFQFLAENLKPQAGLMQDRFSTQMFAVDAWHTYSLNFGVLGALVFINIVFMFLFIGVKLLNHKLVKFGKVNPICYFIVLWLTARICLFPFGDYLLDFSALVELTFFCVVARIAGLSVYSVKRNG